MAHLAAQCDVCGAMLHWPKDAKYGHIIKCRCGTEWELLSQPTATSKPVQIISSKKPKKG